MLKIISILTVLTISLGILNAQSFSIFGKISNKNRPIVGAYVTLPEYKKKATSDKDGSFRLNNLTQGNYTLHISYLGFQTKEIKVTIVSNDVNLENIELQEDLLQLEEIIVSATRNQILRIDAPIFCNVLDNKIFDATQSVVLSEGLNFQPALRIETDCQNCGFTALRMNGLEGAYSQILIDGRPIYSSLQGVYGLEQIPANMIERVEIVRSGGSALYGSSAIAGTVNIITKEPQKSSAYFTTNHAFIDGDSPDQTYMIGIDFLSDDKKTGVSLNGFNRNRKQWDANYDNFSEIGKLKATSFSMKSFYKPTELSKITLNGYNIYEFRRGGNKFDEPYHQADITEALTHNILNGGLTYEQYTTNKIHKFSAYINLQNLNRDSYYGANQDPNAYGNSDEKSLVGGIQYTGKLGLFAMGKHTLVSGFEYNRNRLKDNAPGYNRFIDQTASQLGFYLQDLWEIENKFNVLLGGRLDHHNLVKKLIFSPRANILYKMNKDLKFRIGYAKGYRAPQVFDEDLHITQVNGEGVVIVNSPDLTPEYSNAFSASIDYNKYLKDWLLGITLDGFHTKLTDVFVLEEKGNNSNGDILLERRNSDNAKVIGLTINPKIQYKDKLNLQFGCTFQKSEYGQPVLWSETVENTSKKFFRTPDIYGYYVIAWNATNSLTFNLSGVYTGSMIAQHYAGYIADDRMETTPSFSENNFKFDFTPITKSKFDISFNAGIQNFTNAYQQDFDLGIDRDAGYIYGPGRPRTYFLGMSIKM